MQRINLIAALTVAAFGSVSKAAVIGFEGFDYPSNQTVVGQSGGTGWDLDGDLTRTPWEQERAVNPYAPPVVNGELLTGWGDRDRVSRKFGTDVQATGKVFFGVDVVMEPGTRTAGISWNDRGTPRKVFGLIDQTGKFGVANDWYQNPVDPAELSSVDVVLGQKYRIVGVVDYTAPEASRAKFWVNPASGDEASPIATGSGGGFWIDGINLYSGGTDGTVSARWDNLVVATTFAEAIAIPEPATMMSLGALSLAALVRRRH
jgi:hypothetical protein